MTKLFSTIALLLTPVAAFAAPTQEHRFTSNGATYRYTVSNVSEATVVDGREDATGQRFHYVIRGRHVVGTRGTEAVDFTMPARPLGSEVAFSR